MPFFSRPYLESLDNNHYLSFALANTAIGYQPETHDELCVPDTDRYAGTYLCGVQGSGKSGLLQNMIAEDMQKDHAIIVIDPHSDLIMRSLSQIPQNRLKDAYLLDMEDEAYPFGLNLFHTTPFKTSIERTEAVERIIHIFEVLWPEVTTQQYLPLFLTNTVQVFLDNPGKTLVDMIRFFRDDAFRAAMLKEVKDPALQDFWHYDYDCRSDTERRQRIQPLMNRLQLLFTGHSLVRNILGQSHTTCNFRKAIESRQIIFIKLPTTIVPYIARLIGTILLAQIEAAVFSFTDTPAQNRPGVSLYMDEFQNFSTKDIAKLFTEGRKFGVRLTVAHQQRNQLPDFLQEATMTAWTKVCFQLTPQDGREMAPVFPSQETTVLPEDIDVQPVAHILLRSSDYPEVVQRFVDLYLRPMQTRKRGNKVDIEGKRLNWTFKRGVHTDMMYVPDPTPYLNDLLYHAMRTGSAAGPIPIEAVAGFSGCGRDFFTIARISKGSVELTSRYVFPPHLVVTAADGRQHWTRKPESGQEQYYHCIFHIRQLMEYFAVHPIGKATTTSPADIARMLTQLPRRAAFVRSGQTVGVVYTHDTEPTLSHKALHERTTALLAQTRATYCRPRAEVELLFAQPGTAQSPGATQPIDRWEEIE